MLRYELKVFSQRVALFIPRIKIFISSILTTRSDASVN